MRLIDADELMEHVYRDRLDTRERIAEMIANCPTIKQNSQRERLKTEIMEYFDMRPSTTDLAMNALREIAKIARLEYLIGISSIENPEGEES